MARKDDKAGEEEYTYEVPDFDEDAFIHKELVSFKTTGILFVWGIVAALVSWGLYEAMDGDRSAWYLGIAIVAVMGYLLRFLYPRLKLDISHFGRREWLGTGFLLFFTWLAFFILLINPPISDHAPPIAEVFVPSLQQEGADVTFEVFLEDNHRVADFDFEVVRGSTVVASAADLSDHGSGHYNLTLASPSAGTYSWSVQVQDPKGHEAEAEGTLRVSANAIVVDLPDDRRLDSALDTLLVRFLEPVEYRAVWLDLQHTEDPLFLERDDALGGWKATANFAGWRQGNNSFTVVAEAQNDFFGLHLVPGHQVVHPDTFDLDVEAPVGDYRPPVQTEELISPNARHTPGPSIVLVGLGLLAFVAWRRRE